MEKVYETFEEAVSDGVVTQIHKGGATVAEFNVNELAEKIVKHRPEGYVIDPSISFWEVAEDYAI